MIDGSYTYSNKALKTLFLGKKVSPFLDFSIEGLKNSDAAAAQAAGRIEKILDRYMELPELTEALIARSFLPEKYKRSYFRILKERLARFSRE